MNILFDLYLYVIPCNNNLIKIPHLNRTDAETYAKYWFNMDGMHDYMLVIEGDTPWGDVYPTIEVKTPEWIKTEYHKSIEE